MDFAQALSQASGSLLLAIFIVVLCMGRWVVLARELRNCESERKAQHDADIARLADMKAERDEWKDFALRSVHLGERVVEVAREGGAH